ncbi:MAG: peroxiredoxin [Microlunatus sp.]|nr:peroxiredoxin [Microlunatus sp.]
MTVEIGSTAPDFALRNQHGEAVRLNELRGAPAVLVFYPYAFTGVCSGELAALQQSLADFAAAGARVLAISTDTMYALRVFAEQLGLEFDLLSDFWPHGAVARSYGVFDEDLGCAIRGSFVLDADGRVTWSVRNAVTDARDIGEHLSAVRGA